MSEQVSFPPAPYSIQKCPERQICPKFGPTIVFRGSNQGGPNLSKICRKIEICPEIVVFQFFDKFLTNLPPPPPPIGTPKNNRRGKFWTNLGFPEGPRIEKIQSREAILTKSSFQYRMKISIENGFFIPGPSLATEKQGLGLKFSIENENFKPRMKISSENENFVRGGMFFFMRSSENEFFRSPGPLGSGHF